MRRLIGTAVAAGLAGPAAAQTPPSYTVTASATPQMPGTPGGTGGQPIDPSTVVGPYPGMPKPEPNFWQKLEERWAAMFRPDAVPPPPNNWTPGLARRNRERAAERRNGGVVPWWMN